MRGAGITIALMLAVALAGCGDSGGSASAGGDGAAGRELEQGGFEGRRARTFVGVKEFCEIEPRSEFATSEGLPARSSRRTIARVYAAEWPRKLRRAAFEGCKAGLANVPARFPPSSPAAREIWGRSFVVTSVSGEGDDPPVTRPIRIGLSFSDEREHSVGWQARCNSFGADVRFTTTEMRLGEAGSTLIGCPPEAAKEDRWLADFLEGRPRWQLDGERLRLVSDDAKVELSDR